MFPMFSHDIGSDSQTSRNLVSLEYAVRLYIKIQSLPISTPETWAFYKRDCPIPVLTQKTEVDFQSVVFGIMVSDII